MSTSTALCRVIAMAVCFTTSAPCRAQCMEWSAEFGLTGADDRVNELTVFDDGTGPALYAGGEFTSVDGTIANGIAKWDGSRWSSLGNGANGSVGALVVFDDGSGPALYAGGGFTSIGGVSASRVAKWDGSSWSSLASGVNGSVGALAVFDDGSGAALYAGGSFTSAGGSSANRIAKWDGSGWSALGSGVGSQVLALIGFDDGSGPALYAGVAAVDIGKGLYQSGIARWNGSSWSGTGGIFDGSMTAFAVCDLGAGPTLYAGGGSNGLHGNKHVVRWDGSFWIPFPAQLNDPVSALASFDDGTGTALYATGSFTTAGGVPASRIAKWDGSSWTALGTGLGGFPPASIHGYALAEWNGGSGAALYAGGSFTTAGGGIANRLAQWDGTDWSTVGGNVFGTEGEVRALSVLDVGSEPALYAGGTFTRAGRTLANRVARWDGANWSALGAGVNGTVHALAAFDDGSGAAIYAGGAFTTAGSTSAQRIAKWDGTNWSPLGSGSGGTVLALAVFDDGSGPALYAGHTGGVVEWDGATWSALGTGTSGISASVQSLAVFDDGTGAALYAGGFFMSAGGVTGTRRIARWDGSSWSALGNGANNWVYSVTVGDDGSGPALYIGGVFTTVTGVNALGVARWDGSTWSALGTGLNDWVYSLAGFDDGSGFGLYAGGEFTMAGGISANHIAKWDGSSWSALASGTDDWVYALAAFDDGTDGAPDLYAGGAFLQAGGRGSNSLAAWLGCEPGDAYCFGDGIDSVVSAQCPCGNVGESGHGCANSNSALGGARLFASGKTNPNTILFTCEGVPNNNLCTFLRGTVNDAAGAVFGDGVKCASGTVLRFGQQTAGQGGNASNTVVSPAASVLAGNTRYYQLHYRNPNAGFCPPALFNVSNAYSLAW